MLSIRPLFRIINPAVIPIRGKRAVAQNLILHKEVVDQYKKKQYEDKLAQELLERINSKDEDMPVLDLQNPYEKPPKQCLLCKYDVQLDYKNTRLLSQFVSPHTGQIYGRAVTGLCLYMQKRLAQIIKRSRYFGYMPYQIKDPKYVKDPKLFDPFRRA